MDIITEFKYIKMMLIVMIVFTFHHIWLRDTYSNL